MKKLRLTIYILFFTFNISLFLFSLYIETFDNIFELGALILPRIPYMKYGALIGVILVIVDYVVDKAEKRTLEKEIEVIQNELNATKAKMFDMQSKTESASSAPEESESAEKTNPESE